MEKLGFAIKLANQGASNAIVCNGGKWISRVVDIREYLKLFDGLKGTDNTVTFFSFDEGGCLLTLLRAIPGRAGDFLSGWIYIPHNIEVSGEDVENTYRFVKGILSQSNLADQKGEIEGFFAKSYQLKEYPFQYTPSKGDSYGFRFIGRYSFKEILGENRYQPYYSKYKAVFLLDKNEDVEIVNEEEKHFEDLTGNDIVKTAVILPPAADNLKRLGNGVQILAPNRNIFKAPLIVYLGSELTFILSREGFEDITFVVSVSSDQQTVWPKKDVVWKKKITSSMFSVLDGNNEKIENGLIIKVNGNDVNYGGVILSEEECKQAKVTISSNDYQAYENVHSLLKEPCQIVLHRIVKEKGAEIVLSNGEKALFTIKSQDLPSENSPLLTGYCEYSDGLYGLDPWYVWKQRLYGFATAVITAFLIGLYLSFDAWHDTHEFRWGIPPWEKKTEEQATANTETSNEDNNSNSEQSEPETKDEFSLENAIKYLDENEVWSKPEMDKYPDLVGLYEDLNNFELSRLSHDWANKLTSCQNYRQISSAAEKAYNNMWNPKQGNCDPTYNPPGDEKIKISNYINWLSKDQTPPAPVMENPSVGLNPGGHTTGGGKAANPFSGNNNEPNPSKNNQRQNDKW